MNGKKTNSPSTAPSKGHTDLFEVDIEGSEEAKVDDFVKATSDVKTSTKVKTTAKAKDTKWSESEISVVSTKRVTSHVVRRTEEGDVCS